MRAYLSFLIIASLVLAVVSPACAFVTGGKSWIEICAADGTVKTVPVSADETSQPQPATPYHKIQKECVFCFNTSHIQKMGAGSHISVLRPIQSQYRYADGHAYIPTSLQAHNFSARAPPVFLV